MASQASDSSLPTALKGLQADPALPLRLYKPLCQAHRSVLVQSGSEQTLDASMFLTSECLDGARELPFITSPVFVLPDMPEDSILIDLEAPSLWNRLVDAADSKKCNVEVDPGLLHGIRMGWVLILGMTTRFGPKCAERLRSRTR